MIVSFIGWAIKTFGGGVLDKAIDAFTKSEDNYIQGKEIDSSTAKHAITAYVESHKVESTKWSFPWFPLMAAPFIASIGMFFVVLTAYNIFWHSNGIWPQTWTIAAYPGIYADWATQAFQWVFAPALGIAAIKQILK